MKTKKVTKVPVLKQPNVKLPEYKTNGAAGCDVCANINMPLWIAPGDSLKVPTGLKVSIPEGFCIQILPRSGLALRYGITCHLGLIDSDYRGEIEVILFNLGKERVQINRGERIAQLILQKVEKIEWSLVDTLDETERKTGGFGSTGV